MRIMGLDYGSVTVGVALSDELLLTAQGLEIIRRKEENKLRRTLARLEALIAEYQVEEIVLGYPRNMNHTEGERCEKSDDSGGTSNHDRSRSTERKACKGSGSGGGGIDFTGLSGL